MRALVIAANAETITMPTLPLGPASVAAAARAAGHDVMLLDLMFAPDREAAVERALADFRPGVIGVSVRNVDDQNMSPPQFLLDPVKRVAERCRALSPAPIVLGGAGYSIFPASALRYLGADLGVQGEGEAVFSHLLDEVAAGGSPVRLPGIHTVGNPPQPMAFVGNLDTLPLPEPELWLPAAGPAGDLWVPVQTRRGCPLDCSYCSTSLIEGRSIRMRSPGRVAGWMAELCQRGWRKFNFVDNTFNLPPSYTRDLCREIARAALDIEFWCIIYPKWVDSEMVSLMKAAGCSQISLGFESGSETVLHGLHKRFDPAEVEAISKRFRDAGIERRGFLLLGAPGETRDTVEESLRFADSLALDYLKVTTGVRIYPHTPLAKTAAAEEIIRPDQDLLFPAFYLPPDLRDWLPQRVSEYKASRAWVQ